MQVFRDVTLRRWERRKSLTWIALTATASLLTLISSNHARSVHSADLVQHTFKPPFPGKKKLFTLSISAFKTTGWCSWNVKATAFFHRKLSIICLPTYLLTCTKSMYTRTKPVEIWFVLKCTYYDRISLYDRWMCMVRWWNDIYKRKLKH